jgi:phosphate transport system protein
MTRQQFRIALDELRDQIITMGSYVHEELRHALTALEHLDVDKARQVAAFDREVNRQRFEIEERCFYLIATQAPAASDLRLIFAAANMIVDLERMGDQAKGVAKLIPEMKRFPTITRPPELQQMGALVGEMLQDALRAFADGNVELSRTIAGRDDAVDTLYANVFTQMMYLLAKTDDPEQVRIVYDLIRTARELERFGDLVSNFSERSIYLATGELPGNGAKAQAATTE